jgi:hypothetical protein
VSAALGLGPTVTPLDSLLQGFLAERERGASFGIRLRRAITRRRLGVEVAVDYERSSLVLSPSVLAGIEATRASYGPAFSALIGTGPFVAPTVTSVSTTHETEGSQILTTGALTVNLMTEGRAIPYVTAGAGFAVRTGGTPGASLEGHYQFQTLGRFPMNETDRVSLQTAVDESAVGVFGGGLKFSLASRWGVQFDLRALISKVSIETTLDTNSRASPSAPAAAAASLSTPSLQFSNGGVGPSSLSGPALNGFRTFEGSSWQNRMNVSAGLFLKF